MGKDFKSDFNEYKVKTVISGLAINRKGSRVVPIPLFTYNANDYYHQSSKDPLGKFEQMAV